jgi:hypothetical protein
MTGISDQNLARELERVEEAIARSSTFTRWRDANGRSHFKVDDELLALAEREHEIVRELRRRRRSAATARAMARAVAAA